MRLISISFLLINLFAFVFLVSASLVDQSPSEYLTPFVNSSPEYFGGAFTERIPGSYIVEFIGEPLLIQDASFNKEIESLDEQHSTAVARQQTSKAQRIQTRAERLKRVHNSFLKNQREALELEHQQALKDIQAQFTPPSPLFARIISAYLLHSEQPSAEAQIDEPQPDIGNEYFLTFNGIALKDVDDKNVERIRRSSYVKNIYPSYKMHALLDDSVSLINAKEVWELDANASSCAESGKRCLTGAGVTVAVLDTGIDYTHPDLGGCLGAGCKVAAGYDFVDNDFFPLDEQGHGTHVAGTIAANRDWFYNAFSEAELPLPKHLWEFNASSDSRDRDEIKDSMQPALDGRIVHGVAAQMEGVGGNSIVFDGIDDSIRLPADITLNTPTFSVSAWVKPEANEINGGIFEKTISNHASTQYLLFVEDGHYKFRIIVPSGPVTVDGGSIYSEPVWTHLVGTFNGTAVLLYRNGALVAGAPVNESLSLGQGVSFIGRIGAEDTVHYFNGSIDNVAIYSKGLNLTEIFSIYRAGILVLQDASSLLFPLKGGVMGVAPDATLYAYRVLDASGSGSEASILTALERAADPDGDGDIEDHVDIVSISLGGPGNPDDPLSKSINTLASIGVLSVVAAGNCGPKGSIVQCPNVGDYKTIMSPGTARRALTIGAVNKSFSLAGFSSRGPVIWENGSFLKPDVLAPGVNINSTYLYGTYKIMSGTSMATPHVSGVAALVKQAHPDWDVEEVRQAIHMGTYNLELPLRQQGYGFVDALAVVQSPLRPRIILNTTGMIGGVAFLTVENPAQVPLQISYNLDNDMPAWSALPIERSEQSGAFTSFLVNTYTLPSQLPISLRVQALLGETALSEDRAIVTITNNYISAFENYEIYRAGDMLPISLSIRALKEGYSEFVNYTLEYRKNDTTSSWTSEGLLLCSEGNGEGAAYAHTSSSLCSLSGDRVFIWNTSLISNPGIYEVRLLVSYMHGSDEINVGYIYFDPTLREGWPQHLEFGSLSTHAGNLNPILYDLDGDGGQEIIVSLGRNGYYPFVTVVVLEQNGSLKWATPVGIDIASGAFGTSLPVVPTIGDIDGDDSPDILIYLANYSSIEFSGGQLYALNASGSLKEGWPLIVPNARTAEIIIADINNDGIDEVIVETNDLFHDEYPQEILIIDNRTIIRRWTLPFSLFGGDRKAPALGNFDADSDLEIATLRTVCFPETYDGYSFRLCKNYWPDIQGVLYLYNLDGSVVPGWPQIIGGWVNFGSSPASADIDGDGTSEVLAGFFNDSSNTNHIAAYYSNGSMVLGFPFLVPATLWKSSEQPGVFIRHFPFRSFAFGDLDEDGTLEIITILSGNFLTDHPIYVLYANGSVVPGWPQTIERLSDPEGVRSSDPYGPIIADVDNDGHLDIVASGGSAFSRRYSAPSLNFYRQTSEGGVWAWHSNGTRITGFPKGLHYGADSSPVIGDIDGDGLLDLVASTSYDYDISALKPKGYGSVYVWNLTSSLVSSHQQWLAFRKDSGMSACYDCIIREQGSTTLLNNVQDYDTFIIERKNQGRVLFRDYVDLRRLRGNNNLLKHIVVSRGRISVNTSAIPELNKSAELTFNSLFLHNPWILYNGMPCPADLCTGILYNNVTGVLVMNVSHFSEFEVIEAPVCGDAQCQTFANEDCAVCALDCGACQISSPQSESSNIGSSGGGGGAQVCTSRWNCTLSECTAGIQIKQCKDIASCSSGTVTQENLSCSLPPRVAPLGSNENEKNIPLNNSNTALSAKAHLLSRRMLFGIIGLIIIIALFCILFFDFRKTSNPEPPHNQMNP